MFRTKFWWSLGLTLPIVAYSAMVQDWLGFSPPSFPGDALVAPVLGTVVFLWGGPPFLEGGLAEVRSRRPGFRWLPERCPGRASPLHPPSALAPVASSAQHSSSESVCMTASSNDCPLHVEPR